MTDLAELERRVESASRPGNPGMGARWLRVAVSLLRDAGGDAAREILAASLPAAALEGPGSKGRSWARAVAAAAGDERAALCDEAGHRAGQPDPGKVGMSLYPALAVVREALPGESAERLARALPPEVSRAFRESTATAPWTYRLIPQSYARPEH